MAAANATVPPKKSGGLMKYVVLFIAALALVGGGMAVPLLMAGGSSAAHEAESHKAGSSDKFVFVPFGDVVVNLAEERLTRYIRVKLVLKVDALHEQDMIAAVAKYKAVLKNWLIGHLGDKSLKDVSGGVGVNRLRREIMEQFSALMGPSAKIQDVLFEEFVVQ
jgi:flagellar FliL protein